MIRIHTNCTDGVTEIKYEASIDGEMWKSFDDFIKEDVDVSYHELVRKNVVAATRYFHQRVKAFINKIIMDPNNPMCIRFYSYRVEFQRR